MKNCGGFKRFSELWTLRLCLYVCPLRAAGTTQRHLCEGRWIPDSIQNAVVVGCLPSPAPWSNGHKVQVGETMPQGLYDC